MLYEKTGLPAGFPAPYLPTRRIAQIRLYDLVLNASSSFGRTLLPGAARPPLRFGARG